MHKILVVEDLEIARKLMGVMLEKINCSVDMAENGIEALKLFLANKYDLIFMDLGLPDISGIKLTKLIRNHESNSTSCVPIVAVTAHVEDACKKECLNAGMNGFLLKPLTVDSIQNTINKFVSKTGKK